MKKFLFISLLFFSCGQIPVQEDKSTQDESINAEIVLKKINKRIEQLRNEISHGYAIHPESEYYEGKYETASDALRIITEEINNYYDQKE